MANYKEVRIQRDELLEKIKTLEAVHIHELKQAEKDGYFRGKAEKEYVPSLVERIVYGTQVLADQNPSWDFTLKFSTKPKQEA